LRFYLEAAWAALSVDESDAFAAAYPYDRQFRVIETYAERVFRPGRYLAGIRMGRYRTPFGIYNRSDHAYSGFQRAPLIRYDDNFVLSNNFLEGGADFIAGTPRLYVETSLGLPQDVGEEKRRRGFDGVVRLQGYYGPWIIGASHLRTNPFEPDSEGRAVFTGIDLRWMHAGVLLRGEWISGRPFHGAKTRGWYADAIIHRPSMGPVTAVARCEQLEYQAADLLPRDTKRFTTGARVRLLGALTGQIGIIHQAGGLLRDRSTALDLGLTYSVRPD
jgi:hypothetical protein